jgi:hypothetical protein
MDTFFYIMHFLSEKWEPCYLTIGFFWNNKDFWECHCRFMKCL